MKTVWKILTAGCLCASIAGGITSYADEQAVLQPITYLNEATHAALENQEQQTAQDGSSAQSVSSVQAESGEDSPYSKVAVSQVTDYVNVRTQPNTNSDIVGKIYNNCAATILETVNGEGGEWYRIQSGTVTGYIKAEYFITGKEAETLARQVGWEFVTISTEGLRLRAAADLNSEVLTHLSNGSRYLVQGSEGDFYKIEVDANLAGYVAKQYCKVTVEFDTAVSLEEEQQKLADENQRKQDAENAIQALEVAKLEAGTAGTSGSGTPGGDNVYIEASPIQSDDSVNTSAPVLDNGSSSESSTTTTITAGPNSSSTTTEASAAVTSATRAAIVAYAKQFLGNPYVYGGTSLTNGTDCSGFTQGVFAHFGITTGRSSRDQAAKGRTIAVSAAQPGDLLFYSSGDYINHVAIYIGNGQIIHAASKKSGICIAAYDYRTPCKAVTFLD
jgi:cell wall-associated NlpC family hydrolase